MSRHFFVGIGGTGSRVAEALVYVGASGVLRRDVQVMLIDHDSGNGNYTAALDQLRRYHSLWELRWEGIARPGQSGGAPWWTALGPAVEAQLPKAQSVAATHALGDLDPKLTALVELLFDHEDLTLTLDKGYRGRAHIGSLDVLHRIDEGEWSRVLDLIHDASGQQGEPTQVTLCGSVVGGMGASTLPALAKALKNKLQDSVHLTALLYGPYFSWAGRGDAMDADVPPYQQLPVSARLALTHYLETGSPFDSTLFFGSGTLTPTNQRHAAGGEDQDNDPHLVELAGALEVARSANEDRPRPGGWWACGLRVRPDEEVVRWSAVPGALDLAARPRLLGFFSGLLAHEALLRKEVDRGGHDRVRWHRLMAGQSPLSSGDRGWNDLHEFARRGVEWLARLRTWGPPLVGVAVKERFGDSALARALEREWEPNSIDFASLAFRKKRDGGAAAMMEAIGRADPYLDGRNSVSAYLGVLDSTGRRFYRTTLEERSRP